VKRRGSIGSVRPEVKRARRKLLKETFDARHPEPLTVEEWETLYPRSKAPSDEHWERKRESVEHAREDWEGLRYDEIRPATRKPTGSTLQRLQWLKDYRKEHASKPRVKQKRLTSKELRERRQISREATARHRHKSGKARGGHLEDYCASVCQQHVERVHELRQLEENLEVELLPWAIVQRQLKRAQRLRENASERLRRCEASCYDRELGRRYRTERGFEATGKREPMQYLAKREHEKYHTILRERQKATPEQRRRRMWEEDMLEWSGPALLPAKGPTAKQRHRATQKWMRKQCRHLKGAAREECVRKLMRSSSAKRAAHTS